MSRGSKKLIGNVDNRTYNLVMLNYKRGCPICGPHRGCNRDNKFKGNKSWKRNRKTKWKTN